MIILHAFCTVFNYILHTLCNTYRVIKENSAKKHAKYWTLSRPELHLYYAEDLPCLGRGSAGTHYRIFHSSPTTVWQHFPCPVDCKARWREALVPGIYYKCLCLPLLRPITIMDNIRKENYKGE